MALNTNELNALVIPESVFVKEIYTKTPGWRIKHDGYNFVELVNQVVAQGGSGLFSTLTNNNNGTYTFTPASGSATLIDTRAISNPVETVAVNIPSSNDTVQLALEYLHNDVANTQSLLGVTYTPAEGLIPTMGTFTGWTITDNQSLKSVLQELETYAQDAVHTAENGLTKVSGTSALDESKVKLGGTLTENTIIRAGSFDFTLRDATNGLDFKKTTMGTSIYGSGEDAIYTDGTIGDSLATIGVKNDASSVTPFLYKENTVTNRLQLIELQDDNVNIANQSNANLSQNLELSDQGIFNNIITNAAGTESVYLRIDANSVRIGTNTTSALPTTGHYDLPYVDGAAGEVLTTDGAGTVTWAAGGGGGGLSNELVVMQEFLAAEPIIDRDGDTFFIVPASLNGYELERYDYSVFTTNTGTFDIDLEINGTNVTGGTLNALASAQNSFVTFTTVTLAANDRIRVIVSNSSGSAPQGLTIAMELLKP